MTEHPLMLEAIAKIKSCADGNGIATEKIEWLGCDETILIVHAQMKLMLDMARETATYPGVFKNSKGLPKGRSEKIVDEKDIQDKIKELKTKVETGWLWSKDAERQLKAEQGQGWGLEKADVVLDCFMQTYYSDVPCASCNGTQFIACSGCHATGRIPCSFCRETGFEVCSACNGTGINSAYPDQHCSFCNGTRQVYCRECRGERQIVCVQCRGQGRIKCKPCGGHGVFTTEITIIPTAKAEFIITQSGDLPSGFRKAIARAGLKTLTKGHATISVHELTTTEHGETCIPYTATMPYAEMRLRIQGKSMKCSLLGHKCVILDLPCFIDRAIEDKITRFEADCKLPDTLGKALKLRICREAFGLLQLKRVDAKMLRQLYVTGVSLDMAQRVLDVMRRLVHSQTVIPRMMMAAVSVVVFVVMDYVLITSGARMMLMTKTIPVAVVAFDVVLCFGGYFLQQALLRFVAARKLQQQMGGSEKVISQSAGGIGIIAGVAVMVGYVVMLFVLKTSPDWLTILAHPLG